MKAPRIDASLVNALKNNPQALEALLGSQGPSATVESAIALTKDEVEKLSKVLTDAVGERVAVTCIVKKQLLGGVRVILGDMVIDATVKHQLEELTQSLFE